jgi:hypothetical protein
MLTVLLPGKEVNEGNDDGDKLQEEHEDETEMEAEMNDNNGKNDDHTGDDSELLSHDQEEDYGIIPPPFPEQHVRCSLRAMRGKRPSKYEALFMGVTQDFKQTNEMQPQFDGLQMAMSTVQQTELHPISMYLPEPQTFKAVLELPEELKKAWLHATFIKLKNLIDKETFSLNDWPNLASKYFPPS